MHLIESVEIKNTEVPHTKDRPLRILIIVPSYKPAYVYGGPVRSIAALCEGLFASHQEVDVYTTTANGSIEVEVEAGKIYTVENVNVQYFRRWTKDHTNFSPQLLIQLFFNAKKYDIIHIHSWWNLVTVPATLICLSKGIKPVFSPRGSITSYTILHQKTGLKRFFHFMLGRRLLESVVIQSSSEREDHEVTQLIKNDKRYIIPNILELPDKQNVDREDAPSLQLVFLGRIDRVKNLEYVFSELAEYVKIPFHLTIAGTGEVSYVDALKLITSKIPGIDWAGEVDGEDKFRLLAQSDVLLLPSHTENYGNVVVEALSQGTPVIISDNVGLKNYIIEKELGWVAPTVPRQWANIINAIWDNKSSMIALREKAEACIKRDFNQNEQIGAYLKMYNENRISRNPQKRIY